MPDFTIGTAGHVDHGKSALVEALTGTHPDRLQEEQERGMTIDLGFAFMTLDDGREAPIIDVPGHERFLKTMVAGVSGIRLVLFVIAADEGVMPQTVEHLGAIRYMGIEDGLIVLTKCDLVDEEWMLLVEEDVRTLTQDTFLAQAPILRVSSLTGEGIPELRRAISEASGRMRPRQDNGFFRMPIDRAFTMRGFGTVVAGTVLSGAVSMDDALELLPSRVPARLRGMQTHNRPIERAEAGQRAALNLAGVKVSDVERGHELSVPGYLLPTTLIDARLQALESLDAPISNRTRIRLHKGTAETIGRVILLDRETLEPGDTGYVQFRMENPIVAERQERFIIRGFSSMRLLGGGQLVDVYPQRHRRFRANVLRHLERIAGAGPAELVEETLLNTYGEQQVQSLHSLVQHTNLPQQTVRNEVEKLTAPGSVKGFANDLFMHRERYDRLLRDMVDQIQTLHRSNRLRETVHRDSIRARLSCPIPDVVFDSALRDLVQEGAVIQTGHEIRHPEHRITLTPQEKKMLEAVDQLGKEATLQILTLSDLPRLAPDMRPDAMKGIIAYLFEQGLLVEFADKQIMHRDALERVKNRLIAYLREHETVRAAEFRDYLDISRAHATALLDHFCDRGVTRRESGTHRLRISP